MLLQVNEGKVSMFQALAALGLTLHLYKGTTPPDRDNVQADYTEATFPGYVAKTLIAEQWNYSIGNPTVMTYASQEFAANDDCPDEEIGGYYVVQVGTDKLQWVEPFDTSLHVSLAGQGVLVTPKFDLEEKV